MVKSTRSKIANLYRTMFYQALVDSRETITTETTTLKKPISKDAPSLANSFESIWKINKQEIPKFLADFRRLTKFTKARLHPIVANLFEILRKKCVQT